MLSVIFRILARQHTKLFFKYFAEIGPGFAEATADTQQIIAFHTLMATHQTLP